MITTVVIRRIVRPIQITGRQVAVVEAGVAVATGGVTDHGALTGLADDDHTQYLLVSGTRAMTAALNMGGFAVSNVGTVDGRDVSADGEKLDNIEPGATNNAGALADLDTVGTDQIDNNAVTLAKMEDFAAAGLIGATAAGDPAHLTVAQATALLNAATSSLQGMMSAAQYNQLVWANSETDLGTSTDGTINADASTHGKQKVTLSTGNHSLLPGNITNLSTYGSLELTVFLGGQEINDITGWTVDDNVAIADWVGATSIQFLLQYAHGVNILHVVRITA